jgi:hypothetical protein
MSRLYLARDGTREVWVAAVRGGLVYVYSPETGGFHASRPVTLDFFTEGEMTYEPLTVEQARGKVRAGVGSLDARTMGHVLEAFRTDPHPLPAGDVLDTDPAGLAATRTERVGALVDELVAAPPGEWITWQTYPPEQAQTAQVAAADLRSGRVKTVARRAGPVEARVDHATDGTVTVVVTRTVSAASKAV